MNLRNIFTTALGSFTILAACGNDNDNNITPTPEPKPAPTHGRGKGCYPLRNEHQPYL